MMILPFSSSAEEPLEFQRLLLDYTAISLQMYINSEPG